MTQAFFQRINLEFFQYKWMDIYKKNKKAVQYENAVFTWNGLFFMMVVDLFLFLFYSAVKNGCPEAFRYVCAFPIILIAFFVTRWAYKYNLPDHFLVVGIPYIAGTLTLCFCSFMIIDPAIQSSFYSFFLVTTLLTTLIVDVPRRKLAFLLLWDALMMTTCFVGVSDPYRLRSVFIHGMIVSMASFLFGCFTSWRKLQGFESARELLYMSTHDRLTNLKNREKLYYDFDELTASKDIIGVIIFDINSFKQLNDTYGHIFGDQANEYVASVLRSCEERYGIQLYRYGGDEFIGLVRRLGDERPELLIPYIKQYVADSTLCTLDGIEIRIQISGGCAPYHDGDTLERCVNSADDEMYADKEAMKKTGQISGKVQNCQ